LSNITSDLATSYICQYYKPVNMKLAELRQIGENDNVPIILKETEMVLHTLLNLKQPARILEIGTAIGYSAIYFATVCPNTEVYTIEKDEQMIQSARHNITQAGLDQHIHSLFGDGQEQIEKLASQGINQFDFVFIDAAKSHYKRFFDAAVKVCEPGAVLVSDNILQKGMTMSDAFDTHKRHKTNIRKMREYVEYICHDRSIDTTLMCVGDGLAVSIYRGEYEEREF